LGWTFPDTLKDGNWADIVANFPDLAHVSNIQCENCHGPGSLHKGDKSKIDITLEAGMCGRCHDEMTHHVKNQQWEISKHATGTSFARGTSASCAPCHSGWGFIAAVDPLSDLDQKTGDQNVSCAVCHDPHNAEIEHQVRTVGDVTLFNNEVVTGGGMGQLCMHCHISRRNSAEYVTEYHSYYGPHHGPQTDMLFGTNAITFGVPIPSSNHKNVVENTCVTCHMAAPPDAAENFVGEHTFSMHYDGGTPDNPSDDVDNVTACKACHGPITSFADLKAKMDYDGDGVVESAQAEIKGMLHELGKLLPPLGDPAVNVVAADYDPTLAGLTPEEISQRKLYLKAAYNYFFVEEDKSNGVHNYQYAVNLLKVAHKALTTGSLGAGMITAITDVPNDQGKQVRIGWTRFGGDGVGNNPVRTYAMWRRVDDMTAKASQQNLAVHESFDMSSDALKTLGIGSRVQVNGTLWDFAGSVQAAGHEQYNAIAPTLFDSTTTDGVHWSVFVVSGHTAMPAVQAVSAPDSGYSVDNLAPTAPTSLAGVETVSGIELTWDEPVDADFNYFALYRSTTQGFDPGTLEPIAQLTETTYNDLNVSVKSTYYYRLSAYDFAGNESAYSSEFSLMVTAVEGSDTGAIPEDYVLEQNYPNPFNPSTTINFGLKESGQVTMTIYNALGEEVLQVLNGFMEAGNHRVVIRSENLSSGLYFYKLHVNGFSAVKKMIVMK
ncbi:MAG: T9SS type A sorting domain-containing protein, partial [bacterium]